MAKIMKKTYLLLLTIIMAAGILIAAGVVTAQTAYADTDGYDLWVGDSQVTSGHRSGAGWSFDPGSNTLTLNGFTYRGNGHLAVSTQFSQCGCILYEGERPFNLMIEGNNSITNTNQEKLNAHGIYCASDLTINGTGTLITTSTETNGGMGINCSKTVTINSGTIKATGKQYGINGQQGLFISGGIVEANGASPNGSYGIYGTHGKLLTIDKNVQSVVISGSGAAVYGLLVKNDVEGKGWSDTEGTEDEERIEINKEGRSYSYKKILFNAPPIIVDMPAASAITYGQTLADSILTGGTVKDGEVVVPGTFAWTDETIKPNASDSDKTEYEVTFTPTDIANYDTLTTKVKLTVNKADLIIKANDQNYIYDGQSHGEEDAAYDDPAVIADKVKVYGLQKGDVITVLLLDGAESEIDEYIDRIEITGFTINDNDKTKDNYDVTLLPGKLTITPIPLKVTINGSSAKKVYNGKQQTYTGTVTVKSSDPAFDASKFSYTGSTVVKGTKAGVYTTKLATEGCVYNDPYYELNVMIGSPVKLTIAGEPAVNKATAKIAPKAMTAKGKNALTIHWRKVSGAQGYDIFFSRCGKDTRCKLTKTIKGNSTFSWTKTGLKTKTPYKAYVKGWVMKDGKKKYISTSPMVHAYTSGGTSKYTNSKGVIVKKTSVSLKAGKTYKVKASVTKLQKGKKLMPTGHAPKLRYVSSNKKIATVSRSGKITAKSKGSCKVYVIAVNGASKAVSVTVK